jgi:O-antigen/teichoic acid export membrane protein
MVVLKLMPRPLRLPLAEFLAGSSERSRAGRGAIQAFGIRVISAGLAFLMQVVLARLMGSFEFGIFTTAWVWVTILGTLAPLGFATSVVRLLPDYHEREKANYFRGLLRAGRLTAGLAGTSIMAIGLAILDLWPGLVEPYYRLPLALALLSLPAYAVTDFQDGVGRSQGWIDLALIPPYILRPILILAIFGVAFAAGLPSLAWVAAGSSVVATVIAAVGQFIGQGRRMQTKVVPGARSYAFAEWVRLSLPLMLLDGFTLLMLNLDVLLLNLFEDPGKIGVYFAAARTISLVSFIHFAVAAVAMPRFASLTASGRTAEIWSNLKEMQTWSALPSAAAAGLVLIAGRPLLALFGPDFIQAYPLMFVLAGGLILRAFAGPAQNLLVVTGHQKLAARILMITVFINAGLNLALIPSMGPMGAAIGTAAAFGFEAVATMTMVRRLYRHGAQRI